VVTNLTHPSAPPPPAIGDSRLRRSICQHLPASASITGLAADAPLWDLAKNEIPPARRSGAIEKTDGVVSLRDGAAFAVSAEAFPDQANFTVQVTLSLGELVQDAVFTAMRKQSGEDDGFSFSFNYRETPYHARKVNSVVNGILMTGGSLNGREAPQLNTPCTLTVAVREGLATFYLDDVPCKTCFMALIPNNEPMWVASAVPVPTVLCKSRTASRTCPRACARRSTSRSMRRPEDSRGLSW
jgi:hypothetical protein